MGGARRVFVGGCLAWGVLEPGSCDLAGCLFVQASHACLFVCLQLSLCLSSSLPSSSPSHLSDSEYSLSLSLFSLPPSEKKKREGEAISWGSPGKRGSRDKHVTTPTEGKLHEPMGRGQYHEPEFIGPDGTHIMEGYSTDVITDMTLHFIKRRDQSKPRHVPP